MNRRIKRLYVGNSQYTKNFEIQKILKKRNLDWLLKAEIQNACIQLKGNQVTWLRGTWYDGHWHGHKWKDGEWMHGYWHKGIWENGVWHKGYWFSGEWIQGDEKERKIIEE